jgi:hypothetical protein
VSSGVSIAVQSPGCSRKASCVFNDGLAGFPSLAALW